MGQLIHFSKFDNILVLHVFQKLVSYAKEEIYRFFFTLTKINIFWQFWPELLNWRLMVKFWRIEISLFILIHPFTLSPFLTSYVRPSVTPAPWVRIVRSLGLVFILPKNETSILKHQKRLSLGQQQLGEYQGEPRSDSVGVGQTGPGRTYFYSRAKGSVTSLTLFSQAGASLQGYIF